MHYEMAIIKDAVQTFMNTRQCEHKSLQDFNCRFKKSKDIIKSHLGNPLISSKYIEIMEEFKEAKEEMDYKNEM